MLHIYRHQVLIALALFVLILLPNALILDTESRRAKLDADKFDHFSGVFYATALFYSFQGFFISIIVCFLNPAVWYEFGALFCPGSDVEKREYKRTPASDDTETVVSWQTLSVQSS